MIPPLSPEAPFAEMEIRPEDVEVFKAFERCFHLRDEYLKASFQCTGDNPKDKDGWVAEPPELSISESTSVTSDLYLQSDDKNGQMASSTATLGSIVAPSINVSKTYSLSSYDLDKCIIPGPSQWNFRLGEDSVFHIYSSPEGTCFYRCLSAGF